MFLRPTEKWEQKIQKKDLNKGFKCRYLVALEIMMPFNFFTTLKLTDDPSTSSFM